jgi:hypothetical protein
MRDLGRDFGLLGSRRLPRALDRRSPGQTRARSPNESLATALAGPIQVRLGLLATCESPADPLVTPLQPMTEGDAALSFLDAIHRVQLSC